MLNLTAGHYWKCSFLTSLQLQKQILKVSLLIQFVEFRFAGGTFKYSNSK